MPKAMLMLLLAVVSSSAAAQWVRAGNDGEFAHYADLSTTGKTHNSRVRMRTLIDFKTAHRAAQGITFLSSVTKVEYDCKEGESRDLHTKFYSGNMSRGRVVHVDNNPGVWESIQPGSMSEILWKAACRRS
ncbi:MAG: surface-adhesin E family protein [Pseudomonadota bacterium]